MIKIYLLALSVLVAFSISAQVPPYAKNTGSTGNSTFCWGGGGSSKRVQMLYLPSDFSPAAPSGNITKLHFMMGSTGILANTDYVNPVIKLGQTSNTAFSPATTFYTGLTTVWSPATYSIVSNTQGTWFEINLATPYLYNNAQTLIVEVYFDSYTNTNNTTGLGCFCGTTQSGRKLYSSTLTATTGTTNTSLQNLGLTVIPASPCTSPPAAGTVTSSVSGAICPNTPITLNLNGGNFGSGQTFQWQSSLTAIGGYTNAGSVQSTASFNTSPTQTRYYRAFTVCGTTADTSAPLLVTVNGGLPGGTYTINSGAPASVTNFQSFNAAVAAFQCGITGPIILNVANTSGPYNEQVIIPSIFGTSNINTITINGNGRVLTYAPTVTGERATMKLDGADYIKINNLKIIAAGATYGIGVQMLNDANNNTINGCFIYTDTTATGTGFAGISVSGSATSSTTAGSDCDSIIITNNLINGGYYGITLLGDGTTSQITGNKISGNTLTNFYTYGIYLNGNNDLLVDSNDVGRPTRSNTGSFYGIYHTTGNVGTMIIRNRIHNSNGGELASTALQYGIYLAADGTAAQPIVVANNLVYDINGAGIAYGIYKTGADYNKIWHNTLSMDYIAPTAASAAVAGFYQTAVHTGMDFSNNLITVGRNSTGNRYCVYIATATATFTGANNNYFTSGSSGTTGIGYYSGAAQPTLAAWRAATLQDAASVSINPVYQAPATGNFKPTATSLDNTGIPVGITTDIVNAARSLTGPDIGAYEFGFPPCALPLSVTVGNITATTASLSWTAPVGGASGYEYILNQTAASPTVAGTAIAASPYNATLLAPFTSYYFHVRTACTGGGTSAWVNIPFTTLCINPVAAITSGATSVCQPDSIALNATVTPGVIYQWKLNTVNISGATNATFYAKASGSYTVVASIGTCVTTATAVAITVLPRPDTAVTVTGATTFCLGGSVMLSAPSATGMTYTWLRNNAVIASATTASYTATTSGSYRVIVANANCSDTSAGIAINALALPSAAVSPMGNINACQGTDVVLSGNAGGTGFTYEWLKNGSLIAGATNASYTATASGAYRFVVSNGVCSDTSAATTININPAPSANVTTGSLLTICQGSSVLLNAHAAVTGVTYQWLRNNGVITGATLASYNAALAGNYSVKATITATGCTDTSSPAIPVTIATPPATTVTVVGATTFCQGSGVTLRVAQVPGYTYQWLRNGIAITVNGNTFSYTATTAGAYNVIITNGPCTGTTAITNVVVNPTPVATVNASGPTAFCIGGSVVLSANTGTGLTYLWRNGATVIPGATAATYTATQSGFYQVFVSNGTCTASSTFINVIVSTSPVATITPLGPTNFCQSSSVTLTANTGAGYTYQWLRNGVNIAGATTSMYSTNQAGDYTVTVTNGTCITTSAPKTVTITPGPSATITANGTTTFCQGSDLILSALTGAGYRFQWLRNGVNITGETRSTTRITTSGNYTVFVNDGTCSETSAATTVDVRAIPVVALTQSGSLLSAPATFSTYQWYRNGVAIPGANVATYTAAQNGFYGVVVADNIGCSATSSIVQITSLAVGTVTTGKDVNIYPNPASRLLTIDAGARQVSVVISDIDGREVMNQRQAGLIDVSNLADGTYFIRIVDAKTGMMLSIQKFGKVSR